MLAPVPPAPSVSSFSLRLAPSPPLATHPATRMITRSGSPATVIRKRAKAGPNATKVHPKNTAAPMTGQLGAGGSPGRGRRVGAARRGAGGVRAGRRRNPTRGAVQCHPRTPGKGKGGAPKPRTKVRPTSSTEAEEGTTPGRCPMATSHLIPTPGRPMNT